jgi:hypothetical protein
MFLQYVFFLARPESARAVRHFSVNIGQSIRQSAARVRCLDKHAAIIVDCVLESTMSSP